MNFCLQYDISTNFLGTPGTNTLAGEEKTVPLSKQPTTQTTSLGKWKLGSDQLQESSSRSTTSNASDSLLSDKKEAATRKAEMDGYRASQDQEPKNKKLRSSKQKKLPTPTEDHLKLRSLMDSYDAWEEKLKKKLRKSEIHLCVGIIMKYANADTYPDDDPDENPTHMLLARPGWELFREYKNFADKHPECSNQTKHTGKWEMLHNVIH